MMMGRQRRADSAERTMAGTLRCTGGIGGGTDRAIGGRHVPATTHPPPPPMPPLLAHPSWLQPTLPPHQHQGCCLSDASTTTVAALPIPTLVDRPSSRLSYLSICEDAPCFRTTALGIMEKYGTGKRQGQTQGVRERGRHPSIARTTPPTTS